MNTSVEPKIRYEHPAGYKPDAKLLTSGTHIKDMKAGTSFIASDGRRYAPIYLRTNRCAGGLAEYDLEARCREDGKLYLFHVPVGADELLWTFAKAQK